MTTSRNSRVLRTIPLLITIFLISFPAYAQYSGGMGEPNDPYLIYTAEQMNAIGINPLDWDKHFKLMADIDLSGYMETDFNIIGTDSNPFTGVFDGNGHTISNFSYILTEGRNPTGLFGYNIGLFGYLDGENAQIKDLGLITPNVEVGTGDGVGSLVGLFSGGAISNCYVDGGSVSGDNNVGGLVGSNYLGTITGCYVDGGNVSGNDEVGGLVGVNRSTITNCYTAGSVSGSDMEWIPGVVGGLVGYNYGTISNCYTAGSVSGSSIEWLPSGGGGLVGYNFGTISDCSSSCSVAGDENVGGLVGNNGDSGTITGSYATGTVSGETKVGGLVGNNGYSDFGKITCSYSTSPVTGDNSVGGLVGYNENILIHCYATGSVSGTTNVGGLVGENAYAYTITNCYATGSVTGRENVGGLLGTDDPWGGGVVTLSFWDIQTSGQATSAGGTGKTTDEMQDPNTFKDAEWDFVGKPDGPSDVWAEPAGGGYPVLWWQLSSLLELPTFSGGTGEPNDPYLVSTAADLNIIGHNPRLMAAHFKLTNDIDLVGIDFYIIGSETFPFTGVFDGNGFMISNFSYTSIDTDYVGLFGYVGKWGEDAEIKDLGLIDPNIDARASAMSYKGLYIGSLVGNIQGGTITSCYVEGGSVSGTEDVGGLAGRNYGTITNCYATGSISGSYRIVGGLVGSNLGIITDCYATGSISGNYVGGLVGENWGEVMDSFWDTQTSRQITSAGGTGKITAEMQTAVTFLEAGWDFVDETDNGTEDIWWILEGQDYPRLWWEPFQMIVDE